jgi:COMPASS component SWD1
MLCSVASSGLIHIWKTTYSENWSAFAPGFEELEENVEYQEREDEFDVVSAVLIMFFLFLKHFLLGRSGG